MKAYRLIRRWFLVRKKRTNQYKQAGAKTDFAPNFDAVPIPTLCESIQMIMDNMARRGFPIRDFDNKDKTVKQVGMIAGKVYFLAAKEEEHGEAT